MASTTSVRRTRTDLCPGVSRPWTADDGLLVRLRVVGGRLPLAALLRLAAVAERYADGRIYLTKRANLQLRGLPRERGELPSEVIAAIEETGLLPTRTHELVRNILVSPQTGSAGGRANLRSAAACLDAALRADPYLAALPGRFLFTLDDGRGDLLDRLTGSGRRGTDLGVVALTGEEGQLRVGDHWGEVVQLDEAALHLVGLAAAFLHARGNGRSAPWHVRELGTPLSTPRPADQRIPPPAQALTFGVVPGGEHVQVPDGVLTAQHARRLLDYTHSPDANVVVTPWHGIFVPSAPEAAT
ncbi:nitrite reductase [Mycolicibacterium austroafricanum]|uniref:Nitrite reductase n=1 Tax=Mycolicibacterium austroafricanum TaxID=39687 RepID=A0ABT8H8P3_MYCAO|nr:nitrite reductase [Mycolicibacterium austroafricanum]MDN4517139.1 nitrite reductase [Mycolicibacterium austroafricanum]